MLHYIRNTDRECKCRFRDVISIYCTRGGEQHFKRFYVRAHSPSMHGDYSCAAAILIRYAENSDSI